MQACNTRRVENNSEFASPEGKQGHKIKPCTSRVASDQNKTLNSMKSKLKSFILEILNSV